jgi:hypothetical protein
MRIFSKATVEGFSQIQKINVEINIFASILCLMQQWWPNWHPLLLAAAHNIQ